MKTTSVALTVLSACSLLQFSTAATTPPYGYTTVTCLANSDTIVGLPMRQSAAFTGTLSANPTVNSGSAVLTISGSPGFTVDQFVGVNKGHYVKFKSGAGNGQWFAVTANAAGTITVDLNGATITAVSGNQLEVLKFWTLAELFPPAQATTNPTNTGNAIVASANILPFNRRTELLYPNIAAVGVNGGTSAIYFIDDSDDKWKLSGDAGGADRGSVELWPDIRFTIRHPATVTANTTYTIVGEVEIGQLNIPLNSQASVFQDNYIAIPRPVDVTLAQLNLGGTSAFVSSTGILPFQRGDELFVYDNTVQSINKGPTIYFYDTTWKLSGDGTAANKNTVVIPAGSGILIRKKPNGGGGEQTVFWQQTPSY